MADPSVGKTEGVEHRTDINEARRSSVADVNLNKNVDAKYVNDSNPTPRFLTKLVECRIL